MKNKFFNTSDILQLLKKEPDLLKINNKCSTKFSKKYNKNVKKIKSRGQLPLKMDMNLGKLKKAIKL